MKKINRAVFAVLLVTAALGGCDFLVGPESPAGNGGGGGNLSVSLGGAGNPGGQRAVTSGVDLPPHVLAALRYELVLTGPDGEVLTRRVSGGGNISLTVSLGKWRIDARAYLEDALAGTGSQSFTVMPGDNSVLVPMEMNGGYFDITLDPSISNGTVSPSFDAAFPGTTVTLAVRPGSGYVLKDGALKYNDGSDHVVADAPYTFTMPASDVTVSAEFIISLVRYARDGGSGTQDGQSWENASGDIQKMMDALAAIDPSYTGPRIVKAAAGTYTPEWEPMVPASPGGPYTYTSGGRDSAFILREGVQVWGGYPASGGNDASRNPSTYVTALSGDIGVANNTSDNAYHVVVGVNIPVNGGTVLDGLTITGGNADGSGGLPVGGENISKRNGGGISNYNSSPALIGVTVSGNSTIDHGGGMSNYNSSPVLTDVTISGNSAVQNGGSMYNVNTSKPVLVNATISGNTANQHGGGIYNTYSSPALVNVLISGNRAGTDGGGICNDYSSPALVNVLISGNKTGSGGGGIKNGNSSPSLTNVTISGNLSDWRGGGIYKDSSSTLQIQNSIIWENTAGYAPGIYTDSGPVPVPTYSIVEGIDTTNPQFASPVPASSSPTTGGNYRLQSGPAVNAGSDTLYPNVDAIGTQIGATFSAELEAAINAALAKDLGGANRKNGPIDMGAYERE